jgi:hypothetical protein
MLTCSVLGCSKKVAIDQGQLVGTYKASFDGKTDVLTLNSDGTYLLQRNPGREGQMVQTNSWSLVPYGDETKISLNDFPNPLSKESEEKTSVTLLGMEKKRDELRLYLSYDRDWYYSKAK